MHNRNFRHQILLLGFLFCMMLSRLSALPILEMRSTKATTVEQTQRIVSLSPNVTETIFALEAGNLLVGRSDYCNYPEQALELPSVGTLYNPSLERLLSLEPTLVISSAFVPEQFLQAIENAGVEVLSLDTQQTFQGTYSLIRQIADAVHKESEAELLILQMQNDVRTVALKANTMNKVSVYVAIDFGSFDATATGDTFLHDMIELAGGINVAKEARNWTFNKELLVASEPEVILLNPRWGDTEEQTLKEFTTTKPYSDLTASIRVFDADLISRQGPRSAQALQQLFFLIHQAQEPKQ